MEIRRRPDGLLEPGDSLLFCRRVTDPGHRLRAFSEATGLGYDRIVSTPLCAVPLPRYNGPVRPFNQRWAVVRPEAMWHPLLWLPNRLNQRFRMRDAPGGPAIDEGDDLWSIRMVLELDASALYDQDSGTWLDVLSTVGLDSEDDLDQARVRDWMSGLPDPLLDSIDLTGYLAQTPASHALEGALDLRDDLVLASWAILANDMAALADSGLDPAHPATGTEAVTLVRFLATVGSALLREAPTDRGVPAGQTLEAIAHAAARGEVAASQAPRALADLRDLAYEVREFCWPAVEAINQVEEELALSV